MKAERNKRWRERNPEKAKEMARSASKRYRERHRDQVRSREKEYREKNKEKRKEGWRNWAERNKEKLQERDIMRRGGTPESKVKYLVQVAKWRAKKRGIPFDITAEDIGAPQKCPLLGVDLIYNNRNGHNPNSASIDKIDPSLGYVKGNVWIVSRRANVIKSDATVLEIREILRNLELKLMEIKGS